MPTKRELLELMGLSLALTAIPTTLHATGYGGEGGESGEGGDDGGEGGENGDPGDPPGDTGGGETPGAGPSGGDDRKIYKTSGCTKTNYNSANRCRRRRRYGRYRR